MKPRYICWSEQSEPWFPAEFPFNRSIETRMGYVQTVVLRSESPLENPAALSCRVHEVCSNWLGLPNPQPSKHI